MLSSRTESHNNSEALTPTSNSQNHLGGALCLNTISSLANGPGMEHLKSGGLVGMLGPQPKAPRGRKKIKAENNTGPLLVVPYPLLASGPDQAVTIAKEGKTYRFNTFSNQSYHLWPAVLHLVSHTELNFSNQLFIFCISYRCKVCPLTFLNKSEMQMHSKSHTEAKPHKCPHCSKSFANASYLSQHLRIHLGIKPYHCSYCENSFRQLSHLQQHTRSAELTATPLVHVQLKTIQPD